MPLIHNNHLNAYILLLQVIVPQYILHVGHGEALGGIRDPFQFHGVQEALVPLLKGLDRHIKEDGLATALTRLSAAKVHLEVVHNDWASVKRRRARGLVRVPFIKAVRKVAALLGIWVCVEGVLACAGPLASGVELASDGDHRSVGRRSDGIVNVGH